MLLYKSQISGVRLQDYWSSGSYCAAYILFVNSEVKIKKLKVE